ncbi:MAG: winged helix DNA-binding domain-containing protein [Solirubrobacterales bacterium]
MSAPVRVAARLGSQLLAGPGARTPVEVAERVLALQAQDLRGARLAVRARSDGLHVADVDRALTEDRSLLISWLNRGTLHLVRREDYGWLHALTAPRQHTGNARRLAQEGVEPGTADRGVAVIAGALGEEGPMTRAALGERLDRAGIPTAGQALVHLLMAASLRGVIVRGPLLEGDHAYVLVRDWIGEPEPVDRDRALAELARRYLTGHGPASERDLANWAGLGLRDVRAGLGAIGSELVTSDAGLHELSVRRAPARLRAPRLLGPFDPILHGWKDRDWVLGDASGVVTSNGIFRAIALVDGRAVATWRVRSGEVELAPFAQIAGDTREALERDGRGVVRFLDGD